MIDLFGSTKFIKIEVVETILSSSEEVKKIYKDKINIKDYLSNFDSYLYGVLMLPNRDINKVIDMLNNYIKYMYIPLIKEDSFYIVKSRLISEIMKIKYNKSKIYDKYIKIIKKEYKEIFNKIIDSKEEVEKRIIDNKTKEDIKDILINYYAIYEDKQFVYRIYDGK